MKPILERWKLLLEALDEIRTAADAIAALGLDPRSSYTAAQIKKSFRDVAKTAHPDRGGTEKEFIRVKAAYDRLDKKDYKPSKGGASTPKRTQSRQAKPSQPRQTSSPQANSEDEYKKVNGHGQLYAQVITLFYLLRRADKVDPNLANLLSKNVKNYSTFLNSGTHEKGAEARLKRLAWFIERLKRNPNNAQYIKNAVYETVSFAYNNLSHSYYAGLTSGDWAFKRLEQMWSWLEGNKAAKYR